MDAFKYHAGSAKNALFQSDVVINADFILDFALITDDEVVTHKQILP